MYTAIPTTLRLPGTFDITWRELWRLQEIQRRMDLQIVEPAFKPSGSFGEWNETVLEDHAASGVAWRAPLRAHTPALTLAATQVTAVLRSPPSSSRNDEPCRRLPCNIAVA